MQVEAETAVGGRATGAARADGAIGRNVARVVLRRVPTRVLKAAGPRRLGRVFETFEREDGPPVPLFSRCRDEVTGRWRSFWWPVHVLVRLREDEKLPLDEDALLAEIEQARTLPVCARELAAVAVALAGRSPEDLIPTGLHDLETEVPVVEVMPSAGRLAALEVGYRAVAIAIRRAAETFGVEFDRARILDIGTGSGYLAFALAGLGAREVVGVDLDIDGYRSPLERKLMQTQLAGTRSNHVRLEACDVAKLRYDDASFDIVCSMSTIEHLVDLDACLAELRRVLRPGGLMRHGVDPWFGKSGGHSLCTLDFPWGHVRLSHDDVLRYLERLRPYEFGVARAFYETGFTSPHLTLDESRRAFERAGFRILEWLDVQLPLRDPLRAALDRRVLADCRARHASVTKRDLLSVGYTVTARR